MPCRYNNAKYMTIADLITKRLRAGEFSVEGQFYSRDELAREYHISPGTAQSVLRILGDRGVITCRKGKRSLPAHVMPDNHTSPACRPIFFRGSLTAETPEYDYLTYCVRNILMRQKAELREQDTDLPECEDIAKHAAGDVAVVFSLPSAEIHYRISSRSAVPRAHRSRSFSTRPKTMRYLCSRGRPDWTAPFS